MSDRHTRREAPDKRCATIDANHQPIPLWLDPTANAIYDKLSMPGQAPRWRTWWQWYSEMRGLDVAQAERDEWQKGITDKQGTWWCGNCIRSAVFMDKGEELGYPDLFEIYSLEVTRDSAGDERWLHIARTESVVALTILDIIEGRIRVVARELQAVLS